MYNNIYIYVYIYICIYPQPRSARLVWPRLSILLSILALRLLLVGYIRSPPDFGGQMSWDPPRPWAAFENDVFCSQPLLIITMSLSGFIIVHQNLICCSTSDVLFTVSHSWKTITFSSSIKMDRPGLQNPAPEITCSASCFHWNLKKPYWNYSKNHSLY